MTTKKAIRLLKRPSYEADSPSSALPTFQSLLIHLWRIAVFSEIESIPLAIPSEIPTGIRDSERQKFNADFRHSWLGQ